MMRERRAANRERRENKNIILRLRVMIIGALLIKNKK
jgi:hypothetical protein